MHVFIGQILDVPTSLTIPGTPEVIATQAQDLATSVTRTAISGFTQSAMTLHSFSQSLLSGMSSKSKDQMILAIIRRISA